MSTIAIKLASGQYIVGEALYSRSDTAKVNPVIYVPDNASIYVLEHPVTAYMSPAEQDYLAPMAKAAGMLFDTLPDGVPVANDQTKALPATEGLEREMWLDEYMEAYWGAK